MSDARAQAEGAGSHDPAPARARVYTEQIVVRVTPEQRRWLEECSEDDGRTVAQTLRWVLQLVIDHGLPR